MMGYGYSKSIVSRFPYALASILLLLYSVIGLIVFVNFEFEQVTVMVVSGLLFSVLPAYGALGAWRQKGLPVVITCLFFFFQSIRHVSEDSFLPLIAPITLSFPFEDFSQGRGFLIDFYAVFMAIFLACLAWSLRPTKH